MSHFTKIPFRVLMHRLCKSIRPEISPKQFGFMPDKGGMSFDRNSPKPTETRRNSPKLTETLRNSPKFTTKTSKIPRNSPKLSETHHRTLQNSPKL
ncbi:hypothetical protein PoB_006082300 [Plakobranchus ocellatus]|uniref:Reverse transcriptase domain-containing protein n=1 Tax=Plakobranchus ocellatus TaxID=259542 RepID=A0AAV4CQY1_9GAST|nr:hypothetical protein PoB_006082300 [Plakobranchus ocellatus]